MPSCVSSHDWFRFRQHDILTTCHDAICKIHKCAKCANLHNLAKSSKMAKMRKNTILGGVKNRHISACKSVNFGCSRPWKSRRIMYCLVYRHPPKFDQIGVYRQYGILPKTPKCWPVENLAILGMCNFDIRVHVAYVDFQNCRMIGRNFKSKLIVEK